MRKPLSSALFLALLSSTLLLPAGAVAADEHGELIGLELEASPRCLEGSAYLAVWARNDGEIPVSIEFDSRFGSKTFDVIAPDRYASHAFHSRSTIIEAGWVTATATAIIDDEEVTVERTVNFDELFCVEPPIELTPMVAPRCVAGEVYIAVWVRNDEEIPVDVELVSAFGSRTFTALAPDRFASHAFHPRATSVEDGWVTIRVTAIVDGEQVTVERTPNFAALSCN